MRISSIPTSIMKAAWIKAWANMFWSWAYSPEGMEYVARRNIVSKMMNEERINEDKTTTDPPQKSREP